MEKIEKFTTQFINKWQEAVRSVIKKNSGTSKKESLRKIYELMSEMYFVPSHDQLTEEIIVKLVFCWQSDVGAYVENAALYYLPFKCSLNDLETKRSPLLYSVELCYHCVYQYI